MKDNAFLQARRALLLDHCFFGSLIMHLKEVKTKAGEKDAALWVDGKNIGYDLEQLEKLELSEGAGLIAKGTLHCALGHHLRRGTRDQKLWQQACDLVTNPHILDSGMKLPFGNTTDRQYVDQDLSAEQVYVLLEQEQQKQQQQNQQQQKQSGGGGSGQGTDKGKQQGQGNGNGDGQCEVRDLPGNQPGQGPSPADTSKQDQEWKIAMGQALNNAQARGDLPGSLQKMIARETEPTISWREETRHLLTAIARNDLTWARPNRRFIAQGMYLPATYNERMGHLYIVNDTSGSTQWAQEAFLGEMLAIIEDLNPERVTYVQQDSRIAFEQEVEPGDDFERTIHGMGGTDFRPIFEQIEEQGETPAAMVFLTDLDGPFPEEPDYPVIWANCSSKDRQAPFGTTVYVDVSK